ncbi:MAG: hypothetical protein HY606_10230 [Planctomycetes bacterium]|nr:hypothetical protein [Planctomycetota bacterium]
MQEKVKGKQIVLGISGSISCYKSCDIASKLAQNGAKVICIMTRGATELIKPLTLQTLTEQKVLYKTFDDSITDDPTHIKLAQKTDLLLIAPATANIIGKISHGIADDLLTSFILAVSCPILIAPAMNTKMWENKIVQENVNKLKKLKYTIIEPEEGFLACRDSGPGRLASTDIIIKSIIKLID